MEARFSVKAKRTVLMIAGVAALGALVLRKVDFRERMLNQLAVPHGASGWIAALTMPLAHKAFYRPAADLLQLQSDDELVEIACGSGVFLEKHGQQAGGIAGIDLSDIQVRLARRRLADRITAGTAEIVQGDGAALPWDDETFTAATCMGSLEFFADPAVALREMLRVLKPGGRLVVSYGLDPESEDLVQEMERFGLPAPSEEDARKLVEEAGFSLVSVTYLSGDYPARFLTGTKPE